MLSAQKPPFYPGSMLTVVELVTSRRIAPRAAVVKEAAMAATTVGEYKSPCRLGWSVANARKFRGSLCP